MDSLNASGNSKYHQSNGLSVVLPFEKSNIIEFNFLQYCKNKTLSTASLMEAASRAARIAASSGGVISIEDAQSAAASAIESLVTSIKVDQSNDVYQSTNYSSHTLINNNTADVLYSNSYAYNSRQSSMITLHTKQNEETKQSSNANNIRFTEAILDCYETDIRKRLRKRSLSPDSAGASNANEEDFESRKNRRVSMTNKKNECEEKQKIKNKTTKSSTSKEDDSDSDSYESNTKNIKNYSDEDDQYSMPSYSTVDGEDDESDKGDDFHPANGSTSKIERKTKRKRIAKSTSAFIGVSMSGKDRKWQSRIRHGNKMYYLGRYFCEVEAALEYDAFVYKVRSEKRAANFVPDVFDNPKIRDEISRESLKYGYLPPMYYKYLKPEIREAMEKFPDRLKNRNGGGGGHAHSMDNVSASHHLKHRKRKNDQEVDKAVSSDLSDSDIDDE